MASMARAAAGALGLGALAAGCAPRPDPNAVLFRGWPYEPDLVRANLARFAEQVPGVPVDYAPLSGNYHDKMVALHVAQTELDLIYVRDDFFAEWVEAGWLRPIDDLPGAADYSSEIYPFNLEAMTYDGRLYGLPYYQDFSTWIWNRQMLEQAGFSACGRTLDEITEQCVKIKEKRVAGPDGPLEYPLVLGFKQAALGMNDFWSLMYASEADLFTDDLEPIFPDDEDRRCERIVQWLVDGVHKHRIIDLDASFSTTVVRDVFAAGRQAMISLSKYDLQRLNDPTKSPVVAGHSVMAPYPALEPGLNGTLGWTRMYCIPSTCRKLEPTWQLMQFMGGRAPDGTYSTAKYWYQEKGLGAAYPALLDDPEVIASTGKWGDIDMIREQARYARARENIKAPWFPEFDAFYQAEIQEILQARVSPRDGLARIAAECRRLRREWS
jgi:multiple sugar transport system substrate-binding protein